MRNALAALRQAAATIESPPACRMLSTRSFLLGLLATNFAFLDVPVYWPILLAYFLFLFAFTMRRQIKHMIKHKYNPFEAGKVCCANLRAQQCHEHAGPQLLLLPTCCVCILADHVDVWRHMHANVLTAAAHGRRDVSPHSCTDSRQACRNRTSRSPSEAQIEIVGEDV